MNENDLLKIAKSSAQKMGLPSRRKRIIKEWWQSIYWYWYFTIVYYYCRLMLKIVPKRHRHKYLYL